MFALKQVSLMALLIASAYAAPQLDLEANARNINTEDYINVRDHPKSTLTLWRRVGTKIREWAFLSFRSLKVLMLQSTFGQSVF